MTTTEPTITWEEDIFPTVHLGGGVEWVAHHGAGADTDQIDGKIQRAGAGRDEPYRSLDIWAADGPGNDDLRDANPDIATRAQDAWDEGGVLAINYGVDALVIPGTTLGEDQLLEAFRRFNP